MFSCTLGEGGKCKLKYDYKFHDKTAVIPMNQHLILHHKEWLAGEIKQLKDWQLSSKGLAAGDLTKMFTEPASYYGLPEKRAPTAFPIAQGQQGHRPRVSAAPVPSLGPSGQPSNHVTRLAPVGNGKASGTTLTGQTSSSGLAGTPGQAMHRGSVPSYSQRQTSGHNVVPTQQQPARVNAATRANADDDDDAAAARKKIARRAAAAIERFARADAEDAAMRAAAAKAAKHGIPDFRQLSTGIPVASKTIVRHPAINGVYVPQYLC